METLQGNPRPTPTPPEVTSLFHPRGHMPHRPNRNHQKGVIGLPKREVLYLRLPRELKKQLAEVASTHPQGVNGLLVELLEAMRLPEVRVFAERAKMSIPEVVCRSLYDWGAFEDG